MTAKFVAYHSGVIMDDMNSATVARPRVIESASASTACQTNTSKFAYALTAGVLGVIALIAIGVTLLLFAAFATMNTSGSGYRMDDGYRDGLDWDEDDYGWSDYANELDDLQAL